MHSQMLVEEHLNIKYGESLYLNAIIIHVKFAASEVESSTRIISKDIEIVSNAEQT